MNLIFTSHCSQRQFTGCIISSLVWLKIFNANKLYSWCSRKVCNNDVTVFLLFFFTNNQARKTSTTEILVGEIVGHPIALWMLLLADTTSKTFANLIKVFALRGFLPCGSLTGQTLLHTRSCHQWRNQTQALPRHQAILPYHQF